jgi:hypothetical protein
VIYEVLAVLLAVNMLLLTVMMAFCYKLNHDWTQLVTKLNMEWAAIYGQIMGAYEESEYEDGED